MVPAPKCLADPRGSRDGISRHRRLRAEEARRANQGNVAGARAALADLSGALRAAQVAARAVNNNPLAAEWLRCAMAAPPLRRVPGDGLMPQVPGVHPDLAGHRFGLLRAAVVLGARASRSALTRAPKQARRTPTLSDSGLESFAIDMRRLWETCSPKNNRNRPLSPYAASRSSHGGSSRPYEFVVDVLGVAGFLAEREPIRRAIGQARAQGRREKRPGPEWPAQKRRR